MIIRKRSVKELKKIKNRVLLKFLKREPQSEAEWERELTFLNGLLKKDSLDFYDSEFCLKFKLNSMAFFSTRDGLIELEAGRNRLKAVFEKAETFLLGAKQSGVVMGKRRTLTLKEFLYGKKE